MARHTDLPLLANEAMCLRAAIGDLDDRLMELDRTASAVVEAVIATDLPETRALAICARRIVMQIAALRGWQSEADMLAGNLASGLLHCQEDAA